MRVNSVLVLALTQIAVILASHNSDHFYPFSDLFYLVVSGLFLVFLSAHVISRIVCQKRFFFFIQRFFCTFSPSAANSRRIFILFFVLFSFLGYLDRFLMLGPAFYTPETVMQYRILMVMEEGRNVIKGLSLGNFFIFTMPVFVYFNKKYYRRAAIIILSVLFIFDIYLSSARSSLFLSALIFFFFFVCGKKLGPSLLVNSLPLLGVLFFGFEVIAIVVGKSSEELGILIYAAAPLHAFDQLLSSPELLSGYFLSFYPVQGVAHALFGFEKADQLPNIFTPLPTNVYSMYGVYFNDYGFAGLIVFVAVVGFFSGFVEKGYLVTASPVFRLYSSLNLAILTLNIFYDYYTTSGVVWITFLLAPFFFIDAGRGTSFRRVGRPHPARVKLLVT